MIYVVAFIGVLILLVGTCIWLSVVTATAALIRIADAIEAQNTEYGIGRVDPEDDGGVEPIATEPTSAP